MEFFVKTMFWMFLIETFCKVLNIATGTYAKPVSLNIKCADTVVIAALCIWAGFVIWY